MMYRRFLATGIKRMFPMFPAYLGNFQLGRKVAFMQHSPLRYINLRYPGYIGYI